MSKLDNSRWKLSLSGLTGFIFSIFFYTVVVPDIYGILSFFIIAIVLFLTDVVHIFYTYMKSRKHKK